MPRTQDFSQSTIYHIRLVETKKVCYVGSTTNFEQRKNKHKWVCNSETNKQRHSPIYCYIRENGGWDCFEVIPVSYLKLGTRVELFIEEQKEIDKHEGLINNFRAYRTTEQYAEQLRNSNKKYYEFHKEKIIQYKTLHNSVKIICPICNTMTSRCHLKRHQRSKKCQTYVPTPPTE